MIPLASFGGVARRRGVLTPPGPFSPADCFLVDHAEIIDYPVPLPARPAYLDPYVDPIYGTVVTRIAGDAGTPIGSLGHNWQNISRHRYSKAAEWNADMSLLTLKRNRASTGSADVVPWVFLDGETYEPLFAINPVGGGGVEWHPTDPNVFLQVTSAGILRTWNPSTNVYTTIHELSGYTGCTFGDHEGNPSHDGDWVVVQATRTSDSKLVCFAFQLSTETKHPDIDLVAAGFQLVDWCSISPLANYIVVNGHITAAPSGTDHTKIFDLDGDPVGDPWLAHGRPSHYDLAINDIGEEVAVGESKSPPNEGRVLMRRLSDGAETILSDGGYPSHTSARCINMPGWALSSHQGPLLQSWPPYRDEIFLVKLSATRQVLRLCHIYAEHGGFHNEAHASISPDGKRMVFASNWMSGGGGLPIHAYVCDIRLICAQTSPPPPPPPPPTELLLPIGDPTFTVSGNSGSPVVADIQAKDGAFITAASNSSTLVVRTSMANPQESLRTGGLDQRIEVQAVRNSGGGAGVPRARIEVLLQGGSDVLATSGDLALEAGNDPQSFFLDWDAAVLGGSSPSQAEIRATGVPNGSGGGVRTANIGYVAWTAALESPAENLILHLDAAAEAVRRGLTTAQTAALDQWSDDSGLAHHATQATSANRPVLKWVDGRWFAEFDGINDSLSVANTAAMQFGDQITVALWLRADLLNVLQRVFNTSDVFAATPQDGVEIIVDASFDRLRIGLSGSIATRAGTFLSLTGIGAEAWHHVAFLHSGTLTRGYLDGDLIFTDLEAVGNFGSTNAWRIGRRNSAESQYLDGAISKLQVWNRVLSGTEIAALAADGA